MSIETGAALEQAIAAHLADEHPGSYLKDWVMVASGDMIDAPDRNQYICSSGDNVAIHAAMGLLNVGVIQLNKMYLSE